MTTPEEKLQSYQEAYAIAQELHDVRHQISALRKIGSVHREIQNHREANRFLNIALMTAREHSRRYDEAGILLEMGLNYLDAKAVSLAIYYNRAALHLGHNIKSFLTVGGAWGNLGIVYRTIGGFDIAVDCHKKSIEAYEQLKRSGGIAKGYEIERLKEKANLARLYLIQGKPDMAYDYFLEALKGFQLFGTKLSTRKVLVDLGETLIEQGKYSEAKEKLHQALKLAKRESDIKAQLMALSHLANLYLRKENYNQASNLISQAKDLARKKFFTNERLITLSKKDEAAPDPNFTPVLNYRTTKVEARLLQREGNFEKARDVLEAYTQSAEDAVFRTLESLHQISIFEPILDAYYELIKLLIKMEDFDKAFYYTEQIKSRILLDELRWAVPILPHGMPDKEKRQAQELINIVTRSIEHSYTSNITTAEDLLLPISAEHIASDDNLHLDALIARQEFKALVEHYLSSEQGYALLHGQALTYRDICSAIPKGVMVVEFLWLEDSIETFVFASKWKAPKHCSVLISEKKSVMDWKKNQAKLGNKLLSPLLRWLDDAELVYFIPHGPLHLIPLHALEINGKPFIENYAVAYAPSASVLIHILKRKQLSKKKTTPPSALVVGNPAGSNLPASGREARLVAQLFGGQRYLEHQATKTRVLSELADKDIVHLACHGKFDPIHSLQSGMILAGGEILTAQELMGMRLQADLVTLSACETGRSELQGNELVGLIRALLYAGASTVLVSLWSVDSKSTQKLMVNFYKQLYDKNCFTIQNKAFALRNAMQMVQKEYNDPYYWAPFILVGDWQ